MCYTCVRIRVCVRVIYTSERRDDGYRGFGVCVIINNKLVRAMLELNSVCRHRARYIFREEPHFSTGITVLFSGNFIVNRFE